MAFSAGNSNVLNLFSSNNADTGFNCVEDFFVTKRASVFTDLASNTFVWVSRDEFSVMQSNHVLVLLNYVGEGF